MILPIDSVVDYIYQRHRIRFDSRAAFRAPRLWTKCHGVIVLLFFYVITVTFVILFDVSPLVICECNKTVTRSRTDDLGL
jgi:hypothetical protein